MDVKMGSGPLAWETRYFLYFHARGSHSVIQNFPGKVLFRPLLLRAPRAAIDTRQVETAPPRERTLNCKHRLAPWSRGLPALVNPSLYTIPIVWCFTFNVSVAPHSVFLLKYVLIPHTRARLLAR